MIYSRLILVGFLSTPAVILAQANLFNLGGSYHAGAYSNAVATADLNGDGKLDFVIASYDTKTVTILLGNGAGTFTEPAGSPFAAGARPGSVSLGDFNGDGHPDIALTNPADLVPIGNNRFEGTGSVRLFLGKGDGQFTAAAGSPFPVQGTIGVTSSAVAVDIDHDGRLDLVVAMSSGISVLIGDGAGGLILRLIYPCKDRALMRLLRRTSITTETWTSPSRIPATGAGSNWDSAMALALPLGRKRPWITDLSSARPVALRRATSMAMGFRIC